MSEPARTRRALLEGLSHELRSPLQSLLGFAQLLGSGKLGPLNEEQQEAADALARTARRILQVSEDVLQVARIDAGREEPTWADVALDPLLARELELVRPEAEAKGLALVRAGETGVVAPTDAAKVARIVQNLLTNAIKYTAAGEVRVDVARDDGAVVVEIADTGPGIPADQREAVFEEYVRLEGSGAEGTGLGLPLARRLAELLEGSLDLASTPGTGTCVRLRIPACRS